MEWRSGGVRNVAWKCCGGRPPAPPFSTGTRTHPPERPSPMNRPRLFYVLDSLEEDEVGDQVVAELQHLGPELRSLLVQLCEGLGEPDQALVVELCRRSTGWGLTTLVIERTISSVTDSERMLRSILAFGGAAPHWLFSFCQVTTSATCRSSTWSRSASPGGAGESGRSWSRLPRPRMNWARASGRPGRQSPSA